MATVKIRSLTTTATTSAADDFLVIDGTTNSTRKISAATPAFLTSVTVPTVATAAGVNLNLATGTAASDKVLIPGTLEATAADGLAASVGTLGGASVKKALWVGGTINVAGHTTFEGVTSTGATGTGKLVYDTSPSLTTPALGTPSALVGTNITGTAAGLTAGLAAGLSVTLAVASGGTGQTTANDALNALLPSQAGASGKVLQSDGTNTSFVPASAGGTVTSVSVTTANGVSGTVATSTTTPAISLTLGAIVPTSVNSVVVSGASTPTLAVTGTSSVSGANTGDQTITLTGDVTGSGTGSFATTLATVTVAKGGTGATTLTANNVLLGNGTSAVQFVAPGTTGNVLTSNGTTWSSTAPSGGGISSAGATITTNTTLTAASPGYQPIAMTALGKSVTLPDATTVTVGSPKFYLNNASGAYPVGIRNTSGTLLMAIAAGGTAFVSCQDITTAAGVWNITGDNLEHGLITIDSTFSSTYTTTRLLPFVAFDSNKSLHFLSLSSGFAAVAVDNTTGAVGTPVTVSATASMVPRSVFVITSTTAIVFYSSTTGTLIGVVISLSSATTLTVGTPSSTLTDTGVGVDNFSGAPKIAQLAATLYLVSYATDTGAGTTSVAAFQVSGGTTVNLGSAVNIIATDNVANSTTTYGLTATTGLVIYLSGSASPYTISAVVVSVTNANPPVCTVATPTASGTRQQNSASASCLLSATKALVAIDTNDDIVGARAFTISGTTVTVGALLTLETIGAGTSVQLSYIGNTQVRTRYNPILFPLSASTALFSYVSGTGGISRSVILTESAGTITNGTILYNSVSAGTFTATNGGIIGEQGTSDFLAIRQQGNAAPYTRSAVPHKISGTTITTGNAMLLEKLGVSSSSITFFGTRLSSGDYLLSPTNSEASELTVLRTNGDAINYRQTIKMPFGAGGSFAYPFPKVSSNRIVLIGRPFGSTIDSNSTFQMRLVNIEIAA